MRDDHSLIHHPATEEIKIEIRKHGLLVCPVSKCMVGCHFMQRTAPRRAPESHNFTSERILKGPYRS